MTINSLENSSSVSDAEDEHDIVDKMMVAVVVVF